MDLEAFAHDAKQAGVSSLMLVHVQKTDRCPGWWYNGLQLCDHINGSFPARDGTLEGWQRMVAELRPMRLQWWWNPAYWSTQGEVWDEAKTNPSSDVGRFFSWNKTIDNRTLRVTAMIQRTVRTVRRLSATVTIRA